MKGEILPLFRDVLLVCEEEGLLGGTFFALDGCRLRSNASKEWSGTIWELRKKKDRIEEKVRQLILYRKGYSLGHIQAVLRHQNLNTTSRYLRRLGRSSQETRKSN